MSLNENCVFSATPAFSAVESPVMLKVRQIIPPVTIRALHATVRGGVPQPEGRIVRAWDYKHKRALVIAFLHADCATCRTWLESLRRGASALNECEATALLVFSDTPDARMCEGVPANIVLGMDVTGRSIRAFLGTAALDRAGQNKTGVFVTDRYGELHAQWVEADEGRSKDLPLQMRPGVGHESLPAMEEVLSWLAQVQIACEECYSPHWPVD